MNNVKLHKTLLRICSNAFFHSKRDTEISGCNLSLFPKRKLNAVLGKGVTVEHHALVIGADHDAVLFAHGLRKTVIKEFSF